MRRALAIFTLLALLLVPGAPAATRVWIDTDPSIGSPVREVDDAFALLLAFHSPELRIAGISSTYGNASVDTTTQNARELVRRFGPPIGVFRGASSSRDLGRNTNATEALARVLRDGAQLTYIAIGPLTNLATFLLLHPECSGKIERVIFLGGSSPGSDLRFGWLRIHDANVMKDTAAVELLLRAKIPITAVPIETAAHLALTKSDLRRLAQSGAAGAYLTDNSKAWAWFWNDLVGNDGAPIFDALAVIAAARPEFLRSENRVATVSRGTLVAAKTPTTRGRAVRYCTAFNARTKELVLTRLPAEISGAAAPDSRARKR